MLELTGLSDNHNMAVILLKHLHHLSRPTDTVLHHLSSMVATNRYMLGIEKQGNGKRLRNSRVHHLNKADMDIARYEDMQDADRFSY